MRGWCCCVPACAEVVAVPAKSGDFVIRQFAGSNPAAYIETLEWCLVMYLQGRCLDFSRTYLWKSGPSAELLASYCRAVEAGQITSEQVQHLSTLHASPNRGAYTSPLAPHQFCLALLPGSAAKYLAPPFQFLMDHDSPIGMWTPCVRRIHCG